ncbi:MAG TPA: sulfotransferase family 2 domain-containing protein [Lacipirellulaceae bacterium]|nr:sulfotransferase family 2 domain-containing protein [Lacipirellulaceae bacterium]
MVNPKAACSTLKFALWNQEYGMGATDLRPPKGEYIHLRRTAIPKAGITEIESALFDRPVFSIVRNPYTRILSAYLDKIASDKKEKRHLLLSMGQVENVPIAFDKFIDFICRQNSQEMDSHYAPQASLMQLDYIPYARIGCVEDMENSIATIMTAGYGASLTAVNDFRPHRTGAVSRIAQYYTPDLAAKVRNRFCADFDRFGYSYELADAHLPPRRLDYASQTGRLAYSVLRPMLRAALAEKEHDYPGAFSILSAIESSESDLAATKARLLLKLNKSKEALEILSELVKRVPNISHYWMMLAESLLAMRQTSEAIRAADTAAFIMPSDTILHRALHIMQRSQEWSKAAAYRDRITAVEMLSVGRSLTKRLERGVHRATRRQPLNVEDKQAVLSA